MKGTIPSILSFTRVPLAAAFPFTLHQPAIALAVLAAAALSDVLDGWSARSRGEVTTFGAVLDPITDKLFVGTVVTTLLVVGRLPWFAVLCLATREIGEAPLVAWLLISARQRTHRTRHAGANILGKLVTVLQFVCVVLAIALPTWEVDRVLLGVTAGFGVLAAVSYWRRALAA